MNIPNDILEDLKCSSCEFYLCRSPVYLQHDGAAVCGQCFSPEHPAIRNKQYETAAKLIRFPCKNREFGCPETVSFVQEAEEIAHDTTCEYRQYVCPVLGSAHCDWLGTKKQMLAHCKDKHPDRVLENPSILVHNISTSSTINYLVTAFQLLFLLHTKVCVTTGKIFHSVRFLGDSLEAADFSYTLNIKRNNELLSKEGQVAPQGCLAIQEDTSLALDTNSLLSVLGGFDATTFTVTVKRRIPAEAIQLCVACRAEMMEFRFRDQDGWRCERCAPAKRACIEQDCKHKDIDMKCKKHELCFCEQRTVCRLCQRVIQRKRLLEHYTHFHKTYKAGSTWRVKPGQYWQFCLLASESGTAVCCYTRRERMFSLEVHTPALYEQLHQFRCTVQLTDPATRETRIFTPDISYNKCFDWHIIVNEYEFSSFSGEFNICVDIIKIRNDF